MRRETYPETKSGMLQTSRPGIPHRLRGWEARAQAAVAVARPSRECRRSQAAPSADQPDGNVHGSSRGCGRLDASTPPERETRRAEKSRRRDSSSSSWLVVGRQIKVPRLSASAAGRLVSQGPLHLCLHLSSLSSPHSSAAQNAGEKEEGGGGRRREGGEEEEEEGA